MLNNSCMSDFEHTSFYFILCMKMPKLMMMLYEFMFFSCLCSILAVCPVNGQTIQLVAEFHSGDVNGTVVFTQNETGSVEISLEQLHSPSAAKFTIHKFPVKYEGPMSERCSTESIGDVFGAESCQPNNVHCGNLSGRFDFSKKVATVSNIALSGQDSIFGRSLKIVVENVSACATIKSKSATKIVVGVLRAVSPGIAGSIVLQQPGDNPEAATTVDVNLVLVDARSESMKGLSLAVYETASTSNTQGSCEGIGKIFNPLGKTSCDKRSHRTCPIGDLSAKLGSLDVPLPGHAEAHKFYVDTNLPLSGENSVSGRSLVILSNGNPLICAKIQEYQTMAGQVMLDAGIIEFTQGSLYEPVMVNMSLSGGYSGIAVYDHVSGDSNCNDDGRKLTEIKGSGPVDDLTMYGSNSVMFRLLALDKTGSSQMCKQIKPKDPTYHLKAKVEFNETTQDGVEGFVNIEQVVFDKSKAFASTCSIVMSLWYKNNRSKHTPSHNWHVHISSTGNDSQLAVGKKCKSCQDHYNPYDVYKLFNDYGSTCKPSNPFRCELGDLSSKLGTYDIGGGPKQFIETENYLASWHNIIGRSVVVHEENKGDPRLACANIIPVPSSHYNMETLNVKDTSKTRNKESFQNVVSEALNIDSWRVADVRFKQEKNDKDCLTFTFLLIDDSTSDLHQDFSRLLGDNPEKLKEFVPACGDEPGWKIDEGHSAEIIGVVFGFIILIIFIIVMILWLRKRRQENEDSSKLVQSVDAGFVSSDTTMDAERNDNPPSGPKKDWNVTTSL